MGWEGRETGFNNDGTKVRVYNPITGEIETKRVGEEGTLGWNPSGDRTNWMYDTEGNRVLGYTPEGYEERGGFNPELEGWQAGYQPQPYTVPDRNGMGDDGGQRPGRDVTPPTTVQPGSGVDDGSGGDDPFTPGGGATTTPIDWGSGGGVTGVDGGPDIGPVDYFDAQGFGNSTNEGFYAEQSAAQRTQQLRNAMREQVARQNAKNQPEAGPVSRRDMWDWTLGDKQTLGDRFGAVLGTGEAEPIQWSFNEQYAGQSPTELWDSVNDLSVFNTSESSKSTREVLNNLFKNRADRFGDWDASQYDNATDAFSALNPEIWQGMNRANVAQQGLKTMLNQFYTSPGAGPSAPVGYASPISPGGR